MHISILKTMATTETSMYKGHPQSKLQTSQYRGESKIMLHSPLQQEIEYEQVA
jgi:hypothetical protein